MKEYTIYKKVKYKVTVLKIEKPIDNKKKFKKWLEERPFHFSLGISNDYYFPPSDTFVSENLIKFKIELI